jgi:hypothetical protein
VTDQIAPSLPRSFPVEIRALLEYALANEPA